MKRRWIASGSLGLAYLVGINLTNDPPAYVYQKLGNQAWAAFGLHHFAHPCRRTVQMESGTYGSSLPTDQCYRMLPPRRMRGVWIDEFENSQFLSGANDTSQAEVGLGGTWLDVETNRVSGLFRDSPTTETKAFEIEFIGRQTAYAGKYGHLGGSDHYVVVDSLISIRPVDVSPYVHKLEAWWNQQQR